MPAVERLLAADRVEDGVDAESRRSTSCTASSHPHRASRRAAAPSVFASVSRSSSRSTMTTPTFGKHSASARGDAEAPCCRRREPRARHPHPSPERRMPRSTQAAGSTNTALSSESVSGTLRAASAVARRADQDRVGEAAGLHQVFLEDLAHRLVAAPAKDAFAARHMMRARRRGRLRQSRSRLRRAR